MSDVIDTPIERRESLLQHMSALFTAVKLAAFFIFLGAGAGYIFSEQLLEFFVAPFNEVMGGATKLVYLSPFEKVWVHLRLAFWGGMILVSPGLYYAIYHFVKPALLRNERKRLTGMVIIASCVFAVGIYIGQHYSMPLLLKALLSFKAMDEVPMFSLSAYVNMTMGAILATAVLLEIPVIMFHVSLWGWLSSSKWAEARRFAIVTNAVISGVLSPPDVMSMLVLMVPIQLLYECGILLSRVAEWTRHEKT